MKTSRVKHPHADAQVLFVSLLNFLWNGSYENEAGSSQTEKMIVTSLIARRMEGEGRFMLHSNLSAHGDWVMEAAERKGQMFTTKEQ